MRVRTYDELADTLDEDFVQRRSEIKAIERLVDRSRPTEKAAIVRGGICSLYAHWEGGVKLYADAYIAFVGSRRLGWDTLNSGLQCLILKDILAQLGSTSKFEKIILAADQTFGNPGRRARIGKKTVVNTASNLKHQVLQDLLVSIGGDKNIFLLKNVLIDGLVDQRNYAAHGRLLPVDPSDFTNFAPSIIQMLGDFRLHILEMAREERYRR